MMALRTREFFMKGRLQFGIVLAGITLTTLLMAGCAIPKSEERRGDRTYQNPVFADGMPGTRR